MQTLRFMLMIDEDLITDRQGGDLTADLGHGHHDHVLCCAGLQDLLLLYALGPDLDLLVQKVS